MLQLGDGKCIRVDNMCVGKLVLFFSIYIYIYKAIGPSASVRGWKMH